MNSEKNNKRKEKKSNAQKCREYRERKKLNIVNKQKKRKKNSQMIKHPKSDKERSKQYRDRQKLKKYNGILPTIQDKPKLTPAEYMKEYRRRVKLKKLAMQSNGLTAEDRTGVKKKKTIEVKQRRNKNKKESKKSDSQSASKKLVSQGASKKSVSQSQSKKSHSQSESQATKAKLRRNPKRRTTMKLKHPPQYSDESHVNTDSLQVPVQEEVKEITPEKYPSLEVTVKIEASESDDVTLTSSSALCEEPVPQPVLIKTEPKEVVSEFSVEVIKEEMSDSEDMLYL